MVNDSVPAGTVLLTSKDVELESSAAMNSCRDESLYHVSCRTWLWALFEGNVAQCTLMSKSRLGSPFFYPSHRSSHIFFQMDISAPQLLPQPKSAIAPPGYLQSRHLWPPLVSGDSTQAGKMPCGSGVVFCSGQHYPPGEIWRIHRPSSPPQVHRRIEVRHHRNEGRSCIHVPL